MKDFSDGTVIMWFRRDLRLNDNHALYHALLSGLPVIPIFIFDQNILDALPKTDPRVAFIYDTIVRLKSQLAKRQSDLLTYAVSLMFIVQFILLFVLLIKKVDPEQTY